MSYLEYEDDVLRTLSLQFNIASQPSEPHPAPVHLADAFRRAIKLGEEVDKLKRAVFYGSAYPEPAASEVSGAAIRVAENPGGDYPTPDMIHSAMGIFTEAAEFLAAVYASCFDDQPFDATNAVEELGDLEWYMAVMRKQLAVSQEQVQRINIAKLKARYPDKFATGNALNRDLDRERAVLESSGE